MSEKLLTAMDHLLQLSTLACQAERLDEAFISSEKSSPSSSSSSSSSRQNSVDDTATPLLTAVSTTTRDGKQTATPKRYVLFYRFIIEP